MGGDTTDLEIPRRPSDDDLRTILDRHRAWVESGGRDGARADLSNIDLSFYAIRGAQCAPWSEADSNAVRPRIRGPRATWDRAGTKR